ncbi:MAG TPA: TIGR00725 family protein [Stellaceae bacterium]|jgi:hypothetical protein|nr:TIGR00725 family protein [Stellaceae bacterium]
MKQLYLDRVGGVLCAEGAGRFDAAARRWEASPAPARDPIGLREAVRWLQRDSGMPCRVPIGVIGPRDAKPAERDAAFVIGAGLAGLGLTLICGGKTGVMEAACDGAASAGGLSLGLLPDNEWTAANRFVGVPIATGIGVARNAIIARAALALIAVGGGYGTLSEIAFGLQFSRPVLTLLDAPAVSGTLVMASPEAALDAICEIVLNLPLSRTAGEGG